jgi:hypothetical protein
MSHLINTINGQEPDATGAFVGLTPNQVILIGQGASVNYATSPATGLAAGDDIYLYDTSPTNTIAGATISTTSGWIDSVDLPAGKYHIQAATHVEFSASGSLVYAINEGGSNVTPFGRVGANVTSSYSAGGIASVYVDLTATTTVRFRVQAASNVATVASQGTTPSAHGWMIVRKEV